MNVDDPAIPDKDGWLRVTPIAEVRVTHNGVPLSGDYNELEDRLILDDPDLSLRPIEFCLAVAEEEPERQGENTLTDVLTEVYTKHGTSVGREWIPISPYGTKVQLRINSSPMKVIENIPDDGVRLANSGIPDPSEVLLEAKDHVIEPILTDGETNSSEHEAGV